MASRRACGGRVGMMVVVLLWGCSGPSGGGDGGSNANRNQNDNGTAGELTGAYMPGQTLVVSDEGVQVTVPASAAPSSFMLSARVLESSALPGPAPSGMPLRAVQLGPAGMTFDEDVQVSLQLSATTIATALPILLYDDTAQRWIGSGGLATVSEDGTEAVFSTDHFSVFGIPDPVALPPEGDAIAGILVVSNDGRLMSAAISSETAALVYSEFGTMWDLSATSQELNMQGQIETKALGLDAIAVSTVGQYLVAVIGGGASLFNNGQLNEPLVGIAIMSARDGQVEVSAYLATPERAFAASFSGQSP